MFVTRKHSCVASFNFFLAAQEHIYSKYSHAFLRRRVGGRSPPAEPLARSTCPGYPTKQSRRLIGGFVCVWSWVRWDLHIALMHTFTCPLRGHFRMPRKAVGPAFFSHTPVGQRAVPVRKSDFGLMFSWVKIQRNNLLFLIFTGKKIRFFGFA